jgi:hypothetical protein
MLAVTNSLNRVLIEKLHIAQLVNKISNFCGTFWFVMMETTVAMVTTVPQEPATALLEMIAVIRGYLSTFL